MKHIKKTLSVLLCLVLVFSFAACGKKDADTDATAESSTTQAHKEQSQSFKELGLSEEELEGANKIDKLVEKYNNVTVRYESSDGSSYIWQAFEYNEAIAFVRQDKTANGEISVEGYINGFEFVVEKDRVKAYCDLKDLEKGEDFDENDFITDLFSDKSLAVLDATQEYYKIKSLSEDEKTAGQRYFLFNKETLALTEVTYENAVGNTEKTEITYNGELEEFAKKITESFEDELKAVRVVGEIADDGSVTYVDVELRIPADWEYVPTGEERTDCYMDEQLTEKYEYPGHGKDYTIYVSNIFEDTETGKK